MVSFVHIADIHVGMGFKTASFSGIHGKQRRLEIKETLYRVLDYCEAEKKDFLLIAGDLFEEAYISIGDLKDLNHRFGRLSLTKVMISAGNHDPVIDDKAYYKLIKWCDNVHLFADKPEIYTDEDKQLMIHSFSWNKKHLPALDTHSLPSLQEGYSHVLMLHGDAYGASDYLSFKPDVLAARGYDYIALGHIHKHDYVLPNMAYPGSLEPLDFSETGVHGLIEGIVEPGRCESSFKPFSKRSFHVLTMTCDGEMTYEAIRERLIAMVVSIDKGDMVRIRLSGYLDNDVDLDIEHLIESLNDYIFYVEIIDETEPDLDIEALKKDYEGSLIGAYIDHIETMDIDQQIKKDVLYEGLKIMLREQVTG